MNKYAILAGAAAALLLASPAQANHCDADIADVELLLAAPVTDEPNALEAAEALLDYAIADCDREEQELAEAAPDSPLLDPDHVTVGRSMLFNARDLTQGN